jgi:hypothetical protein
MVFIQFSETQLNTLKNLPNNLNDSLTYHNIGGLLVLSKVNEFKQIIMDFQSYNMDELFTTKKDKKVHLFKHIKNVDEKNNYVITFEIENMLKKSQDKEEYSCFSLPDIFQWIKCVIHSLYRNIYNHLIFTASGKIYIISMKKSYYSTLLRRKISEKISIKEMYHLLMKDYLDIFHNHKLKYKVILSIPEEFKKYFTIYKFECQEKIMFKYITHKPLTVHASIKNLK